MKVLVVLSLDVSDDVRATEFAVSHQGALNNYRQAMQSIARTSLLKVRGFNRRVTTSIEEEVVRCLSGS